VFAQAGAVGAVFGELTPIVPSWDSMAQDQEIAPLLTIPLNFVLVQPFNFMLSQVAAAAQSNISLVVTITYQADPVYVWTQSTSGVFVQTWFCIWFGVCAVIAGVKYLLFVKEQGLEFSNVSQLCLLFTFWVSIMWAIAVTLNYLGSRNNTTQLTMVVLRDFIAVTWIVPTMIFPFYWGELVGSSRSISGLKEARIPFIIAMIIIEGFTLAVAVVKGAYGSNAQVIRAQLCMITILVGLCGIYFTVQGLRVILVLAKAQEGFVKTSIQRRTTFLFLCLALVLFGFTVDYACIFSPSIGITFPDFMCLVLFLWVFAALSLAIIAMTLSPKSLKEVGSRVSSILSARSIAEVSSTSKADADHAKNNDIGMQISETKIVL